MLPLPKARAQRLRALNGSKTHLSARDRGLPVVISLFSGAGGLDLGFVDAGFEVVMALDASPAAIRTHRLNFPASRSEVADLTALGAVGVANLAGERIPEGGQIGVIGGPPCQGFSRANVRSTADDPRNTLPGLYLDIVRSLQARFSVEFLLFENVLGIRDSKHASTFDGLCVGIRSLGFNLSVQELCALDFGVPQVRRRMILSGLRSGQGYSALAPAHVDGPKTVREAIAGLSAPAYFSRDLLAKDIPAHPNHWTMQPRSARFRDPSLLSAKTRSFKRLSWDKASPTIAFGNREIHVHPNGERRISIHEAMRLQGFPESFVLEGNFSEQVTQVSNAVPPPLAKAVATSIREGLRQS